MHAGAAGGVEAALRRYWGFDRLRPLQEEAIAAGLAGRDSLVVLPTGGGKSLCYQVPPAVAGRCDVVVSPLISLMQDQVDGLRACGYPAAALHSGMSPESRRDAVAALQEGRLHLLFVAPERLFASGFVELLGRARVRGFAVDEAHCISHWGHDFRPEYRRLAELRQRFPEASVHAFTATATPRVREDIAGQLRLRDPRVLVGPCDRPNLTYRAVPRRDLRAQVMDVVRRHRGEAVIVYCLSRADTEKIAEHLKGQGVAAAAYHAGMEAEVRRRTQEAFSAERLDVVVATVAFGMGIDRSNVRAVVHATLPRSIEHYQQETGRAGRDGLEAECVLFHGPGDAVRWRRLLDRDVGERGEEAHAAALAQLAAMEGLAGTPDCRHRLLARHFGERYPDRPCGACDVCLGEVQPMPESTVVAQKILSCVARVRQRYGAGHVVAVLRGEETEAILRAGHDRLSTHGLLSGTSRSELTGLVHQLVAQGMLERTDGDYPVLRLTPAGLAVMRGEREARLAKPPARASRRRERAPREDAGWEGVDEALFERLRALRRRLADERGVPAYVIFGDRTLRELARERPTTLDALAGVHGVGERKLRDPGPAFLDEIRAHLGV